MSEIEKLLDELAGFGSLMTRGQLTQPRRVGPRIVGIAEEVRALAAQQDGAWQPIETAPKDGRRVMLWNESWEAPCSGQLYGARWGIYEEHYFKYQPTHWQPLPPPPTT